MFSNPYGGELPGALGEGQSVATALGNFFKFWAYTSTIIGAIVAGMLDPDIICCLTNEYSRSISRQIQDDSASVRHLYRRTHHPSHDFISRRFPTWRGITRPRYSYGRYRFWDRR